MDRIKITQDKLFALSYDIDEVAFPLHLMGESFNCGCDSGRDSKQGWKDYLEAKAQIEKYFNVEWDEHRR